MVIIFNPIPLSPSSSLAHPGAADHRQADPDGPSDRERSVRRGVARPLEGREGSCQSLLHPRGSQLVQRDGDLPDRPDETREHSRYATVRTDSRVLQCTYIHHPKSHQEHKHFRIHTLTAEASFYLQYIWSSIFYTENMLERSFNSI